MIRTFSLLLLLGCLIFSSIACADLIEVVAADGSRLILWSDEPIQLASVPLPVVAGKLRVGDILIHSDGTPLEIVEVNLVSDEAQSPNHVHKDGFGSDSLIDLGIQQRNLGFGMSGSQAFLSPVLDARSQSASTEKVDLLNAFLDAPVVILMLRIAREIGSSYCKDPSSVKAIGDKMRIRISGVGNDETAFNSILVKMFFGGVMGGFMDCDAQANQQEVYQMIPQFLRATSLGSTRMTDGVITVRLNDFPDTEMELPVCAIAAENLRLQEYQEYEATRKSTVEDKRGNEHLASPQNDVVVLDRRGYDEIIDRARFHNRQFDSELTDIPGFLDLPSRLQNEAVENINMIYFERFPEEGYLFEFPIRDTFFIDWIDKEHAERFASGKTGRLLLKAPRRISDVPIVIRRPNASKTK